MPTWDMRRRCSRRIHCSSSSRSTRPGKSSSTAFGKMRSGHPAAGAVQEADPTPRRLENLHGLITAANDWSAPQSFLHRLVYAGYVDGMYTSLRDGTLNRYLPGGLEKTDIADVDVPAVLANVFGVDPSLYLEAVEIHRRYMPAPR